MTINVIMLLYGKS